MFHQGKIQIGETRSMITEDKIFDVYGVNARVVDIGEEAFVLPSHEFVF